MLSLSRGRRFAASAVSPLVAALVAFTLSAAGCSSPCKKLFDMNARCRNGKDGSGKSEFKKQPFLERCNQGGKVWKRYLACTEQPGCEGFRRCIEREATKERAAFNKFIRESEAESRAKEKRKVAKLIAQKDWYHLVLFYCDGGRVTAKEKEPCLSYRANFAKTALAKDSTEVQRQEVLSNCSRWLGWRDVQVPHRRGGTSKHTLGADVNKICERVLRARFDRLRIKGIRARDQGPYKDAIALAQSLEHTASILGREHQKKVEPLCSDLRVSSSVHGALEAVEQMRRSGKAFIPVQCSRSLDQVEISQTAFARKAKVVVLNACYIGLGRRVLKKMFEDRDVSCGYYDREVYNAVKKHQLSDPSIDPLIARAKEYCTK